MHRNDRQDRRQNHCAPRECRACQASVLGLCQSVFLPHMPLLCSSLPTLSKGQRREQFGARKESPRLKIPKCPKVAMLFNTKTNARRSAVPYSRSRPGTRLCVGVRSVMSWVKIFSAPTKYVLKSATIRL